MATTTFTWLGVVPQFLMNNLLTAGNQSEPAIGALADGSYFGAWTHPPAPFEMEGRVIRPDGVPAGNEFLVTSTTSGDQVEASVAGLTNGNAVVTFTDRSVDAGGDIRARLFTAGGAPVALDFGVDTDALFVSRESDVAALADGGFVVTWTRDFGGGHTNTRARLFNADGSPRTDIFGVTFNNSTPLSSVASLASGGFVVAWQEEPIAGGDSEVRFRRFAASGAEIDGFAGILIDSVGSINRDIQIAALPDGGFVVAYTDNGWIGASGTEITARVYNADGSPRSGFLWANDSTAGNQDKPTLTVLANGYFVVGWSNGDQLTTQVYDTNGAPINTNGVAASFVLEGEMATLTAGVVAHVYRSATSDGDGDSIRSVVNEFVRQINGDGTGETLIGDALKDLLFGNGGGDTLIGNAGDDSLNGGAGGDHLDGGPGSDTAVYSISTAVNVNLLAGTASGGEAAGDTFASIENLYGGGQGDVLTGDNGANRIDGVGGPNLLHGLGGDDTLTATGIGGFNVAFGDDGNDKLVFVTSQNELHGGSGNDYLTATANLNVAFGDADNDQLYFVGSQNQLYGGDGNDWLGVNGTNNALVGGAGDEVWIGVSGNANTVAGEDGHDTVFGNGSGNQLYGQNGNDWIGVSGGSNTLLGGAGIDYVAASGSSNALAAGDDGDTLFSVGSNILYGEAGGDWLGCSGNSNQLFGGAGADYLAATGQYNILDGGADADTLFAGTSAHDHVTFAFLPGYGMDQAFNFVGAIGDRIDIRGWGIADYVALTPYLTDTAPGLVIAFDGANQLTINGVHALDPSWIIFS